MNVKRDKKRCVNRVQVYLDEDNYKKFQDCFTESGMISESEFMRTLINRALNPIPLEA